MSEVDPLHIVETIREGVLVLDPDLRSFCDWRKASHDLWVVP